MGQYSIENKEALRWQGWKTIRSHAGHDEEKHEEVLETSLNQLYHNIETSFSTTKRQYATDTIKIANLTWIPFIGLKTLHVKGLAQNEGKEYNPMIVFKRVVYGEGIPVIDNIGHEFKVKPLSWKEHDVLVRCNCMDHFWRFQHFNSKEKCLQGPNRKKYEAKFRPGSANPEEVPGFCKHIIKLAKVLGEAKLLRS